MRGDRTPIGDRPHRAESDSEDTSDPCNECSGSGNYRVPVKSARGTSQKNLSMPVLICFFLDLFHPDSSTDSNEMTPMTERRHISRHLGATPRRHERHRPSSTSR